MKYSLYSINRFSENAPIRLCHLVMHTAFRLRFLVMMPSGRSLLAAKLELES